jgi:membrane protein DedA with SNARE-associated domain
MEPQHTQLLRFGGHKWTSIFKIFIPTLNEFIKSLATLDPSWIYLAVFSLAFIENIFPPSPSDVAVVFGGALAAMEKGNFILALLAGTTGGTLGFMVMYSVGKWFGHKIIENNKLKFIPIENVHKIESWFARYGYGIIVANRFLSGTRAIVSFFAGMSELDLVKTTILSFISSLAWYGILVYAGYTLGDNWEQIGFYLSTYTQIVTGVIIVLVVIFVARYFIKKNKRSPNR